MSNVLSLISEHITLGSLRQRLFPVLTASFIFLAPAGARGQMPPTAKSQADSGYPQEAFVIEKLRTEVSFEGDGTSTRTTTSVVRVQSEAGVQHWGVVSAGYSSTNEKVEIGYVRVRKADGTLVETPADNAQDVTSEVMRVAPTYSDYHEKHVVVMGLGVGDLLEYRITVRLVTPFIPGQFWLGYDFDKADVVLDEEVEVSMPKDREVKVKSPDLQPAIKEQGTRRIYAWKEENHKAIKEEARREYPAPAILVSTFKSWEEVGRWWSELERERATPTPEIGAKADELTRRAATRDEKLHVIYDYVATHFRYIGISFGIGRYQPHAAAEVLKNEYGDCKDKHTLLASLLAAAGIEAYPVLMNSTRHIDPDVPSPGQFDHVISAVPETPGAGKLIFLDTTAEVAPFGFLAFSLRDKLALVVPASSSSVPTTTPADPPFKNYERFAIDATLSDSGVLEGNVQRALRGDSEIIMRALFRQIPQAEWKDFAQRISQAAGFAGEVSDLEVGSPEDISAPFHYSHKYTRKDYPDWANHRIMPPLGFIGVAEIKEEEDRTQPILLGAKNEITEIAKVKLPKGYVPRLLTGVDEVRDFAEYHSTYTFENGVFIAETRLLVKQSEVPLSALKDYQSFQKAISDDRDRYTELVTGTDALFAASPAATKELAGLLQEAQEAMQRRDAEGASDALERALKVDEHCNDAWLMLGPVRLVQGRTNEGIAALRKAIELDPKDPRAYKMLGMTYMRMFRQEEAIAVWRDLLKQDPHDADAHANLGNILLNLKRYSEAVPELEAAMTVNKPPARLKMALANAYVGAGAPAKAADLYKQVAESSLNPGDWNDAAYYLADNHLNLPDAQCYAEKAVKSVEDDASRLRLDKLEVADLARMTRLASYWDTLGWVYFRQGDLGKAQKYLEAAWNLEQNRSHGEHLAEVYDQQGKKGLAEHQHALAQELTDSGGFGPPSARHENSSPLAKPGQTSAVEELSEMRRTKLGKLSTQHGSAEFFVLLVRGGIVEDVKFISGDDQIRAMSKVVASLKFKAPLPDDAPVKLLRRGVLVCIGGNYGCDFTLFTPDSVHSTD